ncbi:hypothetical protein [Arenibacter certesii]|uniref:Lipoprotein n=1 Tax=Arenibacter certesii TaxID=228955 RepID=A0A918IYS1_9FLAO|nr:hypothetical protein [Arenibacter certesii]GGW38587.1 hypothetical protein GCM10007383_24140 [Arenibacter certesii]
MKRTLFLLVVIISSVLASCSVDDGVNYHFEALKVESVEMPESFEYGNIYKIKVTYIRPNNCTYFEGFDVVKEELTTRKVVAVGSVIEDDNAQCTEKLEEVTASFNFEVLYNQPYLFKFWTGEDENGDSEYLEFTVPVTSGSSDQNKE